VNDEALEMLFVESNAAVQCAMSLMDWLLDAKLVIPNIKIEKIALSTAVSPLPPDITAIKLNNRLKKASKILQKKRERLH
jgi:hypothetical protein